MRITALCWRWAKLASNADNGSMLSPDCARIKYGMSAWHACYINFRAGRCGKLGGTNSKALPAVIVNVSNASDSHTTTLSISALFLTYLPDSQAGARRATLAASALLVITSA
ncbi:hypothetical protein [Pseudoalteromonas rubra]|uniref:hypothetical protein n=1 Tax=Pseudoalteromonas rubra TaxID=43658 RepID=UPI0011085E7D|nr:hypothetical protein [Pseudoalteromonas rubra]